MRKSNPETVTLKPFTVVFHTDTLLLCRVHAADPASAIQAATRVGACHLHEIIGVVEG